MADIANTSVLVSLESIQSQTTHCDNIINNIDILIPKLYKIRQQALAQKKYIQDISQSLFNNNQQKNTSDQYIVTEIENATTAAGGDATLEPGNDPTNNAGIVLKISTPQTITNDNWVTTTNTKLINNSNQEISKNIISGHQPLRDVIHSLFKYKHDQGTSVHFTTEQIDNTNDFRTKGLNLNDVESITEGLNDYLKINSLISDKTTVEKALKKLFSPIENPTSTDILNVSQFSTSANTIDSDLKGILNTDSDKILTIDRKMKSKRILFGNKVIPDSTTNVPIDADLDNIRGLSIN